MAGLRLLPALLLFVVVWWAAQFAGAQVEASRGRITAAIIARTGWANPEVIFTAARWLVALAQWVVAPLVAFGLFGALTHGNARSAGSQWLRQALSGRALAAGAVVTLAIALVLAVARRVASRVAAHLGPARLRWRQGRDRPDRVALAVASFIRLAG